MDTFSSYLSMGNGSEALGRLSNGAGDKLKKLKLTNTSKLNNLTNMSLNNSASTNLNGSVNSNINGTLSSNGVNYLNETGPQYEEILVTIRKSERGFGFELKNGILIVKVLPNSPAFNSGIRVGDIVLKINGTCVRTKETHEITNMIHESNSFVSLALQRKLNSQVSNDSSRKEHLGKGDCVYSTENESKFETLTNQPTEKSYSVSSLIPSNILSSTPSRSDQSKTDENIESSLSTSSNGTDLKLDDLDKTLETSDLTSVTTPQVQSEITNKTHKDSERSVSTINRTKSLHNETQKRDQSTNSEKLSSDLLFNSSESINSVSSKTHRKQHSMSNESFQASDKQQNGGNDRKLSDLSSLQRRIQKSRGSTTSAKTYQTQSLSNIASTALIHSNSETDFIDPLNVKHQIQKSQEASSDNDFIIAYKDDFSFTSEDNLHESSTDKNSLDLSGFIDYKQLMTRPFNIAILLNYLLKGSESPKNLYFCIFVDDFLSSNEKKETLARWAFEIHSTFLMQNAPLKVKCNEVTVRKIEEIFEKNMTVDYISSIKKLFDDAKSESIEAVNLQLNKFREVNQMDDLASLYYKNEAAYFEQFFRLSQTSKKNKKKSTSYPVKRSISLANLFQGGGEFLRLYQQNKADSDQLRVSLVGLFPEYINEISNEIHRISSNDWNDPRNQEAVSSALISSFCTYAKRFNLPIKHIGKIDIEKIPTFNNKKFMKIKKVSGNTAHGHNFVECSYMNTRTTCLKCKQAFWGIGNQGLICQKSKCEMKLHRHCLITGISLDCQGSQKKIGSDYKDKLDSFQKILFGSGSKKKDEEDRLEIVKQQISMPSSSFDNVTSRDVEYDRQPSLILSTNGESFEQRNLPVDIAIKRFEMLNKKPTSGQIVGSPTNSTGSILTRANTINNGSVSPTNGANLHRFNSLANSVSYISNNSISEHNSYKKDSNQHQILPNRQYNQASSCNTTSNSNSINNLITKNNNQIINQAENYYQPIVVNKDSANACKRVGSLKVDATKKIKSNIARSKSDPEPEEIKNAQQNAISNYINDKLSIDASTVDANEPSNTLTTVTPQFSRSPSHHNTQNNHHHLPTSMSTSTLTTNSTKSDSRFSWMNDSDMEVEEELPNLSQHICRSLFEELSKKDIKVQEVINELIHTEQKHVRNLKIMQNHFYIPIKADMLLSEEERNLLFPNLEEILELHATFNNKLKKLRKENSVVNVKQLIDVISGQFQGEQGERFQQACATFCQNQSEAMKLLQIKMKMLTDKFTLFLGRSENDVICRKLHLKDFLPTEVQRLVKYRLLFNELTKNMVDEGDRVKLIECMDASSKISLFVNKAVTECENKKRVREIQARLDTKEFDQYCIDCKLMQLVPYKNLILTSRKLIYEGELEWKISNMNNIKLTALLFEDILVFLEKVRTESNNDDKRRYVLRPLVYSIIAKNKRVFTPVIPIPCINSFGSMPDRRQFHIVAIIEEPKESKSNKISSKTNSIETQMLFILISKSGDERNKWTTYFQQLTGKTLQISTVDTITSSQPATTLPSQTLTSTTSLAYLKNSTRTNSSLRPNSMSTSTLLNTKSDFTSLTDNESVLNSSQSKSATIESIFADLDRKKDLEYTTNSDLRTQINASTSLILTELAHRQQLLIKLLRAELPEANPDEDRSLLFTNSSNQLDNSIGLLNTLSLNLNNFDAKKLAPTDLSVHVQNTKLLQKLEESLKKLRDSTEMGSANKLPSLILPTNGLEMHESIIPSIGSEVRNRNRHSFVSYNRSSEPNTATTIDLSEDEQINYYDDEEEDELEEEDDSKNNESEFRRSETSDSERQRDGDEENDSEGQEGEINCDYTDSQSLGEKNFETDKNASITSELTNSEKQSYSEFIKTQISPSKDLINSQIKSQITVLNSIKLDSAVGIGEAPKLPISLPPVLFSNVNEAHNDSSDDEVKDYLSLRDPSLDEISHV